MKTRSKPHARTCSSESFLKLMMALVCSGGPYDQQPICCTTLGPVQRLSLKTIWGNVCVLSENIEAQARKAMFSCHLSAACLHIQQ